MNLSSIIGKKVEQTQSFLEDGRRVPLTRVWIGENSISQIKNNEKDGYSAIQVGFGTRNKISKPLQGHLKKAGIKEQSRFLREIRVEDVSEFETGKKITPDEVLKAGDKVDVVGVSKGKGFAGGVKRWGFRGGPKTHGQSDRHRAPGSIGQSTTPGRVYKGKRMAGRMGQDRVTIKNLQVVEVKDDEVLIRGLVPGPKGGLIMITKVGESKNFTPLFSTVQVEVKAEGVEEKIEEEASVAENTEKVQAEEVGPTEVKDDEVSPEDVQEETEAVSEDKKVEKEANSEDAKEEKTKEE